MTNWRKRKENEREYERLVEQETLIFEATELISELIEEYGVSRKELAEKLGRSKGFVTQVLSGDRNMTLRTLADFAFALEHRVNVAAAPLVESGHGGEAVDEGERVMARVRAGVGELLVTPPPLDETDAPRRPLAAEAEVLLSGSYAHIAYFSELMGQGTEPHLMDAEQTRALHELELVG
jgi:antitoxin component HigA of HigAB toxin-antitoxin module